MSKFDLYDDDFYRLRNNKTYVAASIDLVYPSLFIDRHLESISTKGSLKLFRRSLKKKIKDLFK